MVNYWMIGVGLIFLFIGGVMAGFSRKETEIIILGQVLTVIGSIATWEGFTII